MTLYATPHDLVQRFGAEEIKQLLNQHDNNPPDTTHSRLMNACIDAAGIVDGYLAKAMPLPIKPHPLIIAMSADTII